MKVMDGYWCHFGGDLMVAVLRRPQFRQVPCSRSRTRPHSFPDGPSIRRYEDGTEMSLISCWHTTCALMAAISYGKKQNRLPETKEFCNEKRPWRPPFSR